MKYSIATFVLGLAGLALVGCASQASLTSRNPGAVKPSDRVVVYYMHRTFRCISCLSIEKETRQALDDAFASQLASGQVEFRSEDYWVNKDLADRYGVDTVSVVVVTVANGKEVSHENLERVWELKGNPSELRNYVTQAVRAALNKANG
jgi:hypothetical protein